MTNLPRKGTFNFHPEDAKRNVAVSTAKRQRAENKWRIEGEYVSRVEIAERLNLPVSTVDHRLKRLVKATGAITWARIAQGGQP